MQRAEQRWRHGAQEERVGPPLCRGDIDRRAQAVRGSGQGFCYNAGRGVAAIFPTLVGVMASTWPLREAIGLFAAGAYGLLIVAALLLPETRGRAL